MGSFSDYLEDELLDHVFMTGEYTQPTHLYIALCTTTIEDDDTGDTLPGEASGGSYARKVCDTWDASSSGAIANTGAVTFAQATAAWGLITDFAIIDASTSGNMIAYGKLTTSKQVDSGDTLNFPIGDIDITLT